MMDKVEKLFKAELSQSEGNPGLDVEALLGRVHSKIRRRSVRRRTLLSSPVVILLAVMVFVVSPWDGAEQTLPGGELLIAGWEDSWTEIQDYETEDVDQLLYEQSVDYLIDEQYYSYIDGVDELFDDADLKDFIGYLEEV